MQINTCKNNQSLFLNLESIQTSVYSTDKKFAVWWQNTIFSVRWEISDFAKPWRGSIFGEQTSLLHLHIPYLVSNNKILDLPHYGVFQCWGSIHHFYTYLPYLVFGTKTWFALTMKIQFWGAYIVFTSLHSIFSIQW